MTTFLLGVKVQLALRPGPWIRGPVELTCIGCRTWTPGIPICWPGRKIMACWVGILCPAPVMTCWCNIFGPDDMQQAVVGYKNQNIWLNLGEAFQYVERIRSFLPGY